MSEETDDPMEALVGIVAVATLPLAALAAIFVGETAAAVVAIVGWFFLVPVLGILSEHVDLREWTGWGGSTETEGRDRETEAEVGDAALQRLRERYATGEIDDVEFERRLERLVETEDLDVADHATLDERADDERADDDQRRHRAGGRRPEREPE
ncbi:SHOCT domain-containing protein [Halosimplex amylolyticum]|uniref:SHOCT domain-containing protein n=1 Tax=Halosimplex amylolyticum TaxID=3396616 RepID=UPI003F57A44C